MMMVQIVLKLKFYRAQTTEVLSSILVPLANVELMNAQHLQACIVVVQSIRVVNTAIFTMFQYGKDSVVIFREETQYWISIAVPTVLLIWDQIGQAKTQTLIGMNP